MDTLNRFIRRGAIVIASPGRLETRTVPVTNCLRARVENGRLVLDEPTTLPEGTVVDLVVDDGGDDLTDERRAL